MQRILKRIVVGFILAGSIFLVTGVAASDLDVITEVLPPFNFVQEGRLTGASTQVVQEIMRRLQIGGDIDVLPWARAYKRLVAEPNVVLFTTARTPEREALFHWVGPLFVSRMEFYARQTDPRRFDSLDAARQVSAIATYKDDSGEQILKSLGFTNLDSSNSPHSNILKLVSGRVDLWFFHNTGAPRVAREAGIDVGQIKAVHTHQEIFTYIAISKQTSPLVVQQWQTTLDDMKADGSFWWLARRWLPADAILANERQTRLGPPISLRLYTEDSPPSATVKNGRITGLSVDIVREILRRIGQPDTISMVPWARGYRQALSEANTALFATSRLSQRESLFFWVGPIYRQRWGFYHWKNRPVEITDLDAARRVARIGTYHQDAKMQYLQTLGFENLVPTNKNITNIEHLKRGNIDLWVSSDFNMPHQARQAGVTPDQLELSLAFLTMGNYIAFSKQTSPHIVRLWQAVLDEMKSDGSFLNICRKYGYAPQ